MPQIPAPFRLPPRENAFDFREVFVLDVANNHQGDAAHGERIVREHAAVVKRHGVRALIKFQFRDLDTFVHPAHRSATTNKHVPRFLGTRLDRAGFQRMLDAVHDEGLGAACTPFDEPSVDLICEMGFDVIKVASCSAADWPLLEKVAEAGRPVIVSTGGLSLPQIDSVISFLEHRHVDFAVMHCVSIYPTPDEHFQLNQIDLLRRRHPDLCFGFSTHEPPDETTVISMAVAKGAVMHERHIGVPAEGITLNAYSSTPAHLDTWFAAYRRARLLCGDPEGRPPTAPEERASLDSLRRGVYVKRDLGAGETITRDDVYFAFPIEPGQLDSGRFREGTLAPTALPQDAPVPASLVPDVLTRREIFYRAVHEAKAMLNEAHIALGTGFSVEFSHHYGLDRFREVGAILVDCVNQEYCKKLVIQFAGQRHPAHFHKTKKETFQVLYGVLDIDADGQPYRLYPGQQITLQQGVWHRFSTPCGVIFEEVSTTHVKGDSYYEDKTINATPLERRKTQVENWGRFQFNPNA
jgi:N-acetylneuraminate synthase